MNVFWGAKKYNLVTLNIQFEGVKMNIYFITEKQTQKLSNYIAKGAQSGDSFLFIFYGIM